VEVVDGDGAIDVDFLGYSVVVAANAHHEDDEEWNDEGGDPGAVFELGDEDYEQGDAGGNRSDSIDEDAMGGAGAGLAHPVHDHAGLRKGEGEEGSDSEERDEAVGDATEGDEQERGEGDECVDAVRVE